MRYVARKAGEKMEQAFNPDFRRPQHSPDKEGKVTIDKMPSKSKNSKKPVGDYVDYEEID